MVELASVEKTRLMDSMQWTSSTCVNPTQGGCWQTTRLGDKLSIR